VSLAQAGLVGVAATLAPDPARFNLTSSVAGFPGTSQQRPVARDELFLTAAFFLEFPCAAGAQTPATHQCVAALDQAPSCGGQRIVGIASEQPPRVIELFRAPPDVADVVA
jgi:hypothetical protein